MEHTGKLSVWADESVALTLTSPSGKEINMQRKPDEPVSACLKRVQLSLAKAEKKSGAVTNDSEASLLAPDGITPVPPETPNTTAWQHGGVLKVAGVVWVVERDAPRVATLELPELPLVNFAVDALVELRFANDVTYEWSKVGPSSEVVVLQSSAASSYMPTAEDVGWTLRVTVTPSRASTDGGEQVVGAPVTGECAFCTVAIDPAVLQPMLSRRAQLQPPPPRGVRVVSYNALWGVSADSAAKKDAGARRRRGAEPPPVIRTSAELPVSIYAAAYRQHLLAYELVGYEADVICLQELTEAPYRALAARLAPHGLAGSYGYPSSRAQTTLELATFWREGKLAREAGAVWHVGSLLDEPHSATLRAELERAGPGLAGFVRGQPHLAQATLLRRLRGGASAGARGSGSGGGRGGGREEAEEAEETPLLVLNVHLVQNTLAACARTVQALLVLRQAEVWAASLLGVGASTAAGGGSSEGGAQPAAAGGSVARVAAAEMAEVAEVAPRPFELVLCGDLNAYHPGDGVLSYLAGGEASAASYEWVYGRHLGRRPVRSAAASSSSSSSSSSSAVAAPPTGRCTAAVARGETCPHVVLVEGGELCWDHTCPLCGAAKHNKHPTCLGCADSSHAAGAACHAMAAPSLALPGAASTPPDGPFFTASLAQPEGRGLRNAYADATGTSAVASLPFRPTTGEPVPRPWIDCRDHIFCSARLQVRGALRPPAPPDSMMGMPNLTWPSDHLALVADLEWPADEASDVATHGQGQMAGGATGLPMAKRQKSDPGPLGPRAQRSWGERSLRGALPEPTKQMSLD